jgi:hypothetical protein
VFGLQYIKDGFDYLFSAQVINYSSAHRRVCYAMIADAIEEAVANGKQSSKSAKQNNTTSNDKDKPASKGKREQAVNMNADAIESRLKTLVYEKYGSVADFYNAGSQAKI